MYKNNACQFKRLDYICGKFNEYVAINQTDQQEGPGAGGTGIKEFGDAVLERIGIGRTTSHSTGHRFATDQNGRKDVLTGRNGQGGYG